MEESKKGAQSTSVEDRKNKGDECVKDGEFTEAVLHYTLAIEMDPNNYVLYSNRSLAFLKLDVLYFSLQDAIETVRLQPQLAEGYFRRAEVEAASELYDEALISYTRALQLDPLNTELMEAIKNTRETQKKKYRARQKVMWIWTCVGLLSGIVIVVHDHSLAKTPRLSNPFSMVALLIGLSCIGWMAGRAATMIDSILSNSGKSLQPPRC